MKAKLSFDARGLAAAVLKGSLSALRRAGAYVRRAARHKVKTSDNPSPPGSPPHSRAGLLKRSILFGLDKPAQAVVIGPAESVIGNAMPILCRQTRRRLTLIIMERGTKIASNGKTLK